MTTNNLGVIFAGVTLPDRDCLTPKGKEIVDFLEAWWTADATLQHTITADVHDKEMAIRTEAGNWLNDLTGSTELTKAMHAESAIRNGVDPILDLTKIRADIAFRVFTTLWAEHVLWRTVVMVVPVHTVGVLDSSAGFRADFQGVTAAALDAGCVPSDLPVPAGSFAEDLIQNSAEAAAPPSDPWPATSGEAAPILETYPGGARPEELWAVHLTGEDTILPCASRRLAARNATWLNLTLNAEHERLDDPGQPLSFAVPIRWTLSPSLHTAALQAENLRNRNWSNLSVDVLMQSALARANAMAGAAV